jgi:signal transduction histidine kinase
MVEERMPEVSAGAAEVRGPARGRLAWVLWAVGILLVGVTLTFTMLNGSLSEDPVFLPLAVTMVLGYSTVGALLASRNPGNPIGWLMMTVGLTFLLAGLSDEFLTYTAETNPGSLPGGTLAAWVTNWIWSAMLATLPFLGLLFPTGRVHGPRWRFVPPAILTVGGIAILGQILRPGPIEDVPIRVQNPTGVEAVDNPVVLVVLAAAWIGLAAAEVASIVAVVLRYRRSAGEERQQIRWLAYIAGTIGVVILVALVAGLIGGESFGTSILDDLLFLVSFALIGIGIPAAMGVAVLKYRLYDLDLVVRKTVLYATVAVLLTAIFLVVAVAIGGIAGRSDAGAVVAAAAIGLSFWPALRLARRMADRIVYGGRATPYEVLAEFSTQVAGAYRAEDVLPQMAQILGDAVGARRAVVWLRVGDELRPAAVSPAGDAPVAVRLPGEELPTLPDDAAMEVRDRGELLGAVSVTMPPNDPMNPSKGRLIRDLASQAGLVLRNVRLIEELRESRRRIVAAQDERAKKLERDIHDGAQQQLVALTVKLRLAEQLAGRDDAKTKEMLVQLQGEATDALHNLRDLARGIYPPLLADAGLAAALEAQARKSPVPVVVEADGVGRYPQEVEAAVYFCVLEALQNVAKYARTDRASVHLHEVDGDLTFAVEDDGIGFEPATARGSGLRNMRDRIEALRGELEIRSSAGTGTTVAGRVPARALQAVPS